MPTPALAKAKKPSFDVILWDVGGVLQDMSVFWKKREDLAKKYHVPEEKIVEYSDKYRKDVDLGKMSEEAFWKSALIYAGVSENTLAKDFSYLDMLPYIAPIQGTIDIMERLHKTSIVQGIFSNDSVELAKMKRDKLFPGMVDESFVMVSANIGIKKPDINIYKAALQKVGHENNPARVLFIDDNEANCKPALELGMKCIVFKNPKQLDDELRQLGVK